MNQSKTPLYDALVNHAAKHPYSLHVPGHKNGIVSGLNPYFENILKIDVTELTNLDDLHSPEGVILEAERLLADAYRVNRSFFLVNGSTVGNLAMMMATLQENDIVFIQRNCHKSILNGVNLTKARPILLGPEYLEEWGVAGGLSLETVKEAFMQYPECKAIILTYPNYYGITYELKEIISWAHEHQIPVLIDEAHGAHFIGGDFFPPSAIELGADIVVQSAHKTLPAMTMGSFMHVNSSFICTDRIQTYLRILQSSSPSYPIMASLDIARKYIATYTKEDQAYLQETLAEFKEEIRDCKYFRVLDYPNNSFGDPLKLTIQSQSSLTGYELQRLFEENGIYTEMADPRNVLFVMPLLKKDMPYPLKEITKHLKDINVSPMEINQANQIFSKTRVSTLHNVHSKKGVVPFSESVHYICAETIIPYPPGIPLLLQGERITVEDIKSLALLLSSGARFQGGEYLSEGKIKVFLKTEDNHD